MLKSLTDIQAHGQTLAQKHLPWGLYALRLCNTRSQLQSAIVGLSQKLSTLIYVITEDIEKCNLNQKGSNLRQVNKPFTLHPPAKRNKLSA